MLNLTKIPQDVISEVLSHLEVSDIRSVAQVNKLFYAITNRKLYWKKRLLELKISENTLNSPLWQSLAIRFPEILHDNNFKTIYYRAKNLYQRGVPRITKSMQMCSLILLFESLPLLKAFQELTHRTIDKNLLDEAALLGNLAVVQYLDQHITSDIDTLHAAILGGHPSTIQHLFTTQAQNRYPLANNANRLTLNRGLQDRVMCLRDLTTFITFNDYFLEKKEACLYQLLAYDDPFTCLNYAKEKGINLSLFALKPLIFRKHLPAIRLLLDEHLKVIQIPFDSNLFFWVVGHSNKAMLLYFEEKGISLMQGIQNVAKEDSSDEKINKFKRDAIHTAVFYGNIEAIKFLIEERGILPDKSLLTTNFLPFFKKILFRTSSINGCNYWLKSEVWCLEILLPRFGQKGIILQIAQYLVMQGILLDYEILNEAVENKMDIYIIECLIEQGIKPNQQTLAVAVTHANLEVIQYLVEKQSLLIDDLIMKEYYASSRYKLYRTHCENKRSIPDDSNHLEKTQAITNYLETNVQHNNRLLNKV